MMQIILDWIYNNPSWLVTLVFLVTALIVSSIGLFLAYAITNRETRNRHRELTSFTVTNIAVLYAVLLAFIAVATWESFSRASDVAQTEANLVSNLFHDTEGLPEPLGDELRPLIQQYLRVVIDKEWPTQQEGVVPTEGWESLDLVQTKITTIVPANSGQAVLMQEMLHTLNNLYSARNSRLAAVDGHIPPMVWFVIIAVGALTIGYSCFVGAEGILIHMVMLAGLTVALTLVVVLIIELDYPFRGAISVSPDPYQLILHHIDTDMQSNRR